MDPRTSWKCLLWCCVLLAAEAPADEAASRRGSASDRFPGSSFTLGLRTGVGLPLGNLQGGDGEGPDESLRSLVKAILPLQLDVGVLQSSRLYAGAYVQYGRGSASRSCSGGSSCSLSAVRMGFTVSYHLPRPGDWSPWLGVGAGYEFLRLEPRSPQSAPSFIRGAEFFNLQGGADFHVSGPAWVGPFATLSLGKYLDVNEVEYHSWLIGGVQLQLRL